MTVDYDGDDNAGNMEEEDVEVEVSDTAAPGPLAPNAQRPQAPRKSKHCTLCNIVSRLYLYVIFCKKCGYVGVDVSLKTTNFDHPCAA